MNAFLDRGRDYVDGQYVGPKTLEEAIIENRKVVQELAACPQSYMNHDLSERRAAASNHLGIFVMQSSPAEMIQAILACS